MTDNQAEILRLADLFLLSVCECETNPDKLLEAIETWRLARKAIEEPHNSVATA